MNCPCKRLQLQAEITARGETRIAKNPRMVCQDCGKVFHMQSVGSGNSLLMMAKPPAPLKKKTSRTEEYQRTFDALATEWREHGGDVPAWLATGLIHTFSTVKDDPSMLIVGAAGGLIPYTIDRGGTNHAVVEADDATRALLSSLQRTEVHPPTWKPDYGRLFNGVIIAGELSDEWRARIPSLLKPLGDCWLVGPGKQYASELAQAWGYEPRKFHGGDQTEYLYFRGHDTPLGEGPGTELHNSIASLGMPECQQCRALARRMNEWGVAGSRERFDEIIADMLPRAQAWWQETDYREKLRVWWKSNPTLSKAMRSGKQLAQRDLDKLLTEVLTEHAHRAIEAAEQKLTAEHVENAE